MEDYICHYGRKNQKWGVRNGPPYPIEDTVLRAGTRLNSVANEPITETYKNTGRSIYTYRPDELWDKKVYEGPFADFLISERGAERIRVHEFETIADMKMPTSKERKDRFKELLDDNKKGKVAKKELEETQRMALEYNMVNPNKRDQYEKLDVNNIKTKKDLNLAYNLFLFELENPYENKSSREYMSIMKKNYDAMVDDNDQGGYNDARDPIIIFNARKFLKDAADQKTPRFLTTDEIMANINKLAYELKKKNK